MSIPGDKDPSEKPDGMEILFADIARAMREGACVSPCGTEGCQWDGFPEHPEDSDGAE